MVNISHIITTITDLGSFWQLLLKLTPRNQAQRNGVKIEKINSKKKKAELKLGIISLA